MTSAPARRNESWGELGPAMRALPIKWQRCVDALFLADGDQSKAIRVAGYEGKPASLNVMASRIFGDDRVRAAIKEECTRRIEGSEPELLAVTRKIMHDTGEKAADRLRAVAMVWDRANPVMTKHRIEVEHYMTDDERDIQHYYGLKKLGAPRDAFLARFGPNGIARVEALVLAEEGRRRQIEAGNTIAVEYQDVTLAEEPAEEPDDPPANQPPAAIEFDESLL